VADPLGAGGQSSADRFRTGGLAGVGGDVQALIPGVLERFAKPFRGPTVFVAADAEGHHAIRGPFGGQPGDLHGVFGTEVANGVEDPPHFDR